MRSSASSSAAIEAELEAEAIEPRLRGGVRTGGISLNKHSFIKYIYIIFIIILYCYCFFYSCLWCPARRLANASGVQTAEAYLVASEPALELAGLDVVRDLQLEGLLTLGANEHLHRFR